MGLLKERIAIDLGTAYSIVAHRESDQFWRIPSSVAVDVHTRSPVAFGEQAKTMMGKGSTHYEVIRPLKDGVISDFDAAGHYLTYLVSRARLNKFVLKTDILICVPWGATEVETKSYKDRVRGLFTQLRIVREPFAAALGAGRDIFSPEGCTVVDLGGGTVEISTVARGHMAHCSSVRMAGTAMDLMIVERFLRTKLFEIGVNTAEEIKIQYGSVYPVEPDFLFEVKGLDRRSHGPNRLQVSTGDLREFLEPISQTIETTLKEHLQHLPPESQIAVATDGIFLVGGGANLRGWKARLEANLGIKVTVAEEPHLAVIRGMKKIIDNPRRFEPVLKISENTRRFS